jgi:hypothetical protein
MSEKPLPDRLIRYATSRGLKVTEYLGGGTDGSVWKTDQHRAIKLFAIERTYRTEVACYQRLAEHDLQQICGLTVPRLCGQDDNLWIIEIEIVSPLACSILERLISIYGLRTRRKRCNITTWNSKTYGETTSLPSKPFFGN